MLDTTRLTLREMTECGNALRHCGHQATCTQEVGQHLVDFLFETLGDAHGEQSACILARFFKTQPYQALTPSAQEAARKMLGAVEPVPDMKCLTLLATRGVHADWNTPATSAGHRAIPLPSADALASIPMLSRLVAQLGIPLATLFAPSPRLIADLTQRTYNVFHVADAAGSPYVPAQDTFVVPYNVRSVIGLGGVLPSSEMFSLILFLRVALSPSIASLFKPLAVSAKLALIPFDGVEESEQREAEQKVAA